MQSDLTNASQQLKIYQIDHSSFPTSLNASNCPLDSLGVVDNTYCLRPSSGNTFLYSSNNNSNSQTFSLYAVNTSTSTKYRTTDNSSPVIAPPVAATGGDTVTNANGYRIHKFTTVGTSTFTVNSGDNVEVMVVGGGGGGGSSQGGGGGGGGGGAGGLIYYTSFTVAPQAYTVTVGNGGAPGGTNLSQSGINGVNSVFGTITATGGGFGGSQGANGSDGGSGGGGGFNGYAAVRLGGSGVLSQGNTGGNTSLLSWAGGAGGGGAGSIGGDNKIDHNGGDRGLGLTYSISGIPVTYSVGGGGGANSPIASTANIGKGGDAAYSAGTSFSGGSGIVIIRYPN